MLRLFGVQSKLDIPEPPSAPSPNEPAPIVSHKLDFEALGFPEYKNRYALVIDNLFTPADSQKLLDAAESAKKWEVAQINGEGSAGFTDLSYRNSSRILYDDVELSAWILEKLRPYVGEIESVDSSRHHVYSNSARDRKERENVPDTVQLWRINERLRYLRYGPGEYFKRHCDGTYYTDDRRDVSYYTIQIYLNGDAEGLEGGATRFFSNRVKKGSEKHIDVNPRAGRVLIFEQAGLLHSGEEVVKGSKITIRTELMYREAPAMDEASDTQRPLAEG